MARRASPASAAELDAAARRLAAIIAGGARGAALARALALEGVRGRAGLRAPAVFARLPRESQARVLYSPARSTPLAAAAAAAAEIARRLAFASAPAGPGPFEVLPVGSVRRGAARVKDLDFLVVAPAGTALGRLERVLAAAALRPPRPGDRATLLDTYAAGPRRRSLVIGWAGAGPEAAPGARARRHLRADLFLATAAERPFALYHYTGPSQYNIRVRALAKRRGWRLNQYGVFDAATGQRAQGAGRVRTERDLAAFLGVTYRPPEARGGAVAAAVAAAAAAAAAPTAGPPARPKAPRRPKS